MADRLIEQEHFGIGDQRAAKRGALLLAARYFSRPAVEQSVDAQQRRHVADLAVDRAGIHAARLQRAGDILIDGKMGIEGVGLEGHGDAPPIGRELRLVLAADDHPPGIGRFEPGNQPQQRRLADARRTDDDEELAFLDAERQPVDDRKVPALAQFLDLEPLPCQPFTTPSDRPRTM